MVTPYIIMPVKDSLETAELAIHAIVNSGYSLTVYDDNSTPENKEKLDGLSKKLGIEIVHIGDFITTPSPNYRWVLINAQQRAIDRSQNLIIIESDVIVKEKTITQLQESVKPGVGMIAAVTVDKEGEINFPYEYAQKIKQDGACKKRLSFCCTLLSNEFLHSLDFEQLNPDKNWYDVYISHKSIELGFTNILQISNPVLHMPHSSRPWKQLKYTHPILYYWRKITQHKDKI